MFPYPKHQVRSSWRGELVAHHVHVVTHGCTARCDTTTIMVLRLSHLVESHPVEHVRVRKVLREVVHGVRRRGEVGAVRDGGAVGEGEPSWVHDLAVERHFGDRVQTD